MEEREEITEPSFRMDLNAAAVAVVVVIVVVVVVVILSSTQGEKK